MAKAKKLLLRGASFRHLDMRMGEGAAFIRAHIVADITPETADKFGWQIYQDGHLISGLVGSTKLDGQLNLTELQFKVNGTKTDPLECRASSAEDFQLTRRKTETGDGVETQLRFIVISLDWESLTNFFGHLGTADGALKFELADEKEDAQPTLAEQPHLQEAEDNPDPEPAEEEPVRGKSRSGSLAPKVVMEKIQ